MRYNTIAPIFYSEAEDIIYDSSRLNLSEAA